MFLTLKLIFNFLCQICGVMFRALMFSESIQLWYKHCSSVSINYFSLVLIICSNNFTIQLVRKLVYNLWSLSCLFLSCVLGSLLLLSPQSFFPWFIIDFKQLGVLLVYCLLAGKYQQIGWAVPPPPMYLSVILAYFSPRHWVVFLDATDTSIFLNDIYWVVAWTERDSAHILAMKRVMSNGVWFIVWFLRGI